jgi:diguanylate cyclase (GGDEF)-like protein
MPPGSFPIRSGRAVSAFRASSGVLFLQTRIPNIFSSSKGTPTMPGGWLRLRYLGLIPAAFLVGHALCIVLTLPHSMAASYPFCIAAPWLACGACAWRSAVTRGRSRPGWVLLTSALLLWASGMSISAYEDLSRHSSQTVAYLSDFVYFVYGVPILLALSSSAESEQAPLFLGLDAVQAATTACLMYVMLFSSFPLLGGQARPIRANLLELTYNVENLALAVGATFRVFAHTGKSDDRRFYRILAVFLWAYALCAALYNALTLALLEQTGLYDLLVDIPFLLVAVLALIPAAEESEGTAAQTNQPLKLFLDNASPILYTLALLALGAANVRGHFALGIVAIVIALVVYALRATTLQSRYMRSERALRVARDQLEQLSLQDPLTGVANRRSFDQALEMEWHRAVRTQQPLTLLLIDIDHFKSLNDRFGHRFGDRCLREVAQTLRSALPRSGDMLARYGGEEFASILIDTDRDGAEVVAHRMLEGVRGVHIPHPKASKQLTSISIGIATWRPPQSGSPAMLLEAADRALYGAKQHGRDRLEHAPELAQMGEIPGERSPRRTSDANSPSE